MNNKEIIESIKVSIDATNPEEIELISNLKKAIQLIEKAGN